MDVEDLLGNRSGRVQNSEPLPKHWKERQFQRASHNSERKYYDFLSSDTKVELGTLSPQPSQVS